MGNKPSLNCSGVTLRYTAFLEGNETEYPQAAHAHTQDLYVDNTFITSNNICKILVYLALLWSVIAGVTQTKCQIYSGK